MVVRTGGGFLKLEDFLAKYSLAAANVPSSLLDGGSEVGTVVRKAGGISLAGFR